MQKDIEITDDMKSSMPVNPVYGPVSSWRVGQSLGIDLICETSVCSFNCIYCQLGSIQVITNERRLFVPTDTIMQHFRRSAWQEADIITYSGSGEPTLAVNLGEVIQEIRKITTIPQLVLTNGTLLDNPEVRKALQAVNRVYVKLDAASEAVFQRVNRPVDGIEQRRIIENVNSFRAEYKGYLGIQMMLMPGQNLREIEGFCNILNEIQPDEVQLNTPTRPYPKEWHLSSRGGHTPELRDYTGVTLRKLTHEEAKDIEKRLIERTGLKIVSVYQH